MSEPTRGVALVAKVREGQCPLCGRWGFKNVALHTHRAHGVDRKDLADLLGLRWRDSLASDEYAEQCRERALSAGVRPPVSRRGSIAGHFSKAARQTRAEAYQRRWSDEQDRNRRASIGGEAKAAAIRRAQPDLPSLPCDACGRVFVNVSNLRRHVRNAHG